MSQNTDNWTDHSVFFKSGIAAHEKFIADRQQNPNTYTPACPYNSRSEPCEDWLAGWNMAAEHYLRMIDPEQFEQD